MTDPDSPTDQGFAVLGESACWELVPTSGVGRVAWVEPDGRILVVPVNFGRDGHTVIIRTGGTDLREAALAGQRCAFQIDDLEPGLRSGWTVLLDGTLTEIDDEDIADRLARLVDPWLHEPRPYVLLLQTTGISGRSLHSVGGVQIIEWQRDDLPSQV